MSDPEQLFATAAGHYTRYRESYPPSLWEHLVTTVRLDGSQRALDLGCGSGQVAIPLSAHVAHVVAVDPSAEMLAAGRGAATAAGATRIEWRQGDSTRLGSLDVGELDLAVMGRSFHWMDRGGVLRDLDRMIRPGGAVALLHTGVSPEEPPPWVAVVEDVRRRYLGADGDRPWQASGGSRATWAGHEQALRASAFAHLDTWQSRRAVVHDLDTVVGLQFTYSVSTPRRFGDRVADYEADLRRELSRAVPGGQFPATVTSRLLIARRLP